MDYLTVDRIKEQQRVIQEASEPKLGFTGPALYILIGISVFVIAYMIKKKKKHGRI